MHQPRASMPSISANHRSGNGPLSPVSPNSPRRPLLPLYAALEHRGSSRRRYHSRRHIDVGLTQMMMNHRGSILSTASLALINAVRRPSDSDHVDLMNKKRLSKERLWSRFKACVQFAYEKSHFKKLLPLLILLTYSVLGGAVVYWIEAPIERIEIEGKQRFLNEQKELLVQKVMDIRVQRLSKRQAMMNLREAVHWYTISTMYMDGNLTRLPPPTTEIVSRVGVLKKYTEEMARRCWEIRLESFNRTDVKRKLDGALTLFELYTGVITEVKTIWTFSNAVFLAVTIYTTIGYGSVAPHTVAGRVATIIYAIIGIPVYLMILHKLGRVFLKLLRGLWNLTLRFASYTNCFKSSFGDKVGEKDESVSGKDSAGSAVDDDCNIPVSLAVGVTFLWMLTCAGVCCLFFETSWDYFTSFYFFFISLTTIGFGDVTPTHPEYMFLMFGLIIVGLSLVSMCINVVQLKLEFLFEEMMLALMEEYEKSGRSLDNDMIMESALSQRGLGFFQMMKLWRRKRRGADGGSDAFAELMLPPANIIRRGAFLRELRRRRRARTIGTQTEFWKGLSLGEIRDWQPDMPPWMNASFDRRQKRKLLLLHEYTQTDQSELAARLTGDYDATTNASSSRVYAQWPVAGLYPTDQADATRSVSSSMVTCEDNIPIANCAVTIEEVDDNDNERGRIQIEIVEDRKSNSDSSLLADGSEGSALSQDLIPFIPYIEQEVPLEQEQEQPFRRWSAAEAMSVFAHWAANRAIRKDQSRCSSADEEYDDDRKLAHFQNTGKLTGRRVTVAGGAPASLKRKALSRTRSRTPFTPTLHAASTMRLQSMEPSQNDLRTMDIKESKQPILLTVDSSVRHKIAEKGSSVV